MRGSSLSRRGAAAFLVACAGVAVGADDAIDPIEFQEIPGNREFTGELIVKPLPHVDLVEQGLTREQARARRDEALRALDEYVVVRQLNFTDEPARVIAVPQGRTEGEVAAELMATGSFEYVHPNWRVFPVVCPDDARFDDQWHHDTDHMDSCEGWDVFTGDPSVSVGICDTGVDIGHTDLDGNHVEGYNATTQLFESEGGVITPSGSHGTYVAGCAAAEGNDGFGVVGVGWDLSYRPVRVSENGSSSTLAILIDGATTSVEAGDRVANVSFSGVDAPAIRDAATSIKQMGGLLVWSAGNDGRFLSGDRDADDLIVAGATDINDNLAGFSARGTFVDVVAPGADVFTSSPNNSFRSVSGTSFSAPLTAGLLGLIFASDPGLTPDEAELILKQGVDDLGADGIDNTFGYGRINVAGSMAFATPPIEIDLVGELPDSIDPEGGTSFQVMAQDGTEQLDESSGLLVFDDGTGEQTVELNDLGGGLFEAVFPTTDCPTDVSFFVSFETTDGEEVNFPRSAPTTTLSAPAFVDSTEVFADNFETDQGWTVTNSPGLTAGAWERGFPEGNNRGDPGEDGDGSGRAYLTEINPTNENSDVDDGSTTLTSPVFDLAGAEAAILTYSRWFSNDFGSNPGQDPWIVQITDDGSNWVDLENTTSGAASWVDMSFPVQDFVDLTSQVQVRFIAQDDAQNGSVVEAGVDGVDITTLTCSDADPCPADLTGPGGDGVPDGNLSSDDFFFYLGLFSSGDPQADLTGPGGDGVPDGNLTGDDFFFYLGQFAAGCP